MKRFLPLILVALVACEDKKPEGASSGAASASASAMPVASSPPTDSAGSFASAAPSASAAPAASASAGGTSKDVTLSVQDPKTDANKSVKVPVGGSVTVWLPEWSNTSWKVPTVDKTLGKAKEQTIPGFAGPSTPAHEFKWKIEGPSFKAGQSYKVQIVNTPKGAPAGTTFTLSIEIV